MELIRRLWFVCILRDGPQELPLRPRTLVWVIALHLLVGTAYGLPFNDWGAALQLELASLLITLAFVAAALALARRQGRFDKTAVALLGSDIFITAIGLVLAMVLWLGLGLGELWLSASTLLMAWSFVVSAHIFRHAFSTTFVLGLGLALVFFLTLILFLAVIQSTLAN